MRFFYRYKELILYCIFGILTFLIDVGLFWIFELFFDQEHQPILMHVCSVTATTAAITFAYITNRQFVFESQSAGWKSILREVAMFYGARGFTLILSEVLLHITAVVMGFSPTLTKPVINVIVIVLNYIFSKFLIFKKKPTMTEEKADEKETVGI